MSDESLKSLLVDYLADLDMAQARMLDVFHERQVNPAKGGTLESAKANSKYESAIEELRTLAARRLELLTLAQSQGMAVSNLQELALRLEGADGSLAKSSRLLKRKMETLHYASLSHWITCQKAYLHYTDLVQLIANGGRKPMMQGNTRLQSQGGVILDAKV